MRLEKLEERCLMATLMCNAEHPDVNNDGQVTPADALVIANALYANQGPFTQIDTQSGYWFDVNYDRVVNPLDFKSVVDYLNQYGAGDYNSECYVPLSIIPIESNQWLITIDAELLEYLVLSDEVSNPLVNGQAVDLVFASEAWLVPVFKEPIDLVFQFDGEAELIGLSVDSIYQDLSTLGLGW